MYCDEVLIILLYNTIGVVSCRYPDDIYVIITHLLPITTSSENGRSPLSYSCGDILRHVRTCALSGGGK